MNDAPAGKKPRRNVPAQERILCVLYDFAAKLGAPIEIEGVEVGWRRDTVRDFLDKAMEAFGYVVTPIQ